MADFWKNKRVLVTGGHGFLGKHLVKRLNKKGCKLFAPRHEDYDLRSVDEVMAMVEDAGEIDVLFHLAANVGGIGYNQEKPYTLFYDNAIMGINLIHLSLIHEIKKFVQVGTTCSYPKHCSLPFRESDIWYGYPEETNAPYGIAKRMLLAQLQAAREQYGFNGIYVILANLYGPGDHFEKERSHVIPALIKKVNEAGDTVTVWGTGNATRDFLYVEDAVSGLMLAAEKYDEPEPLNLGSGRAITIAALINIIKKIMASEAKTIWDISKPDGQPRRSLDIIRARLRLEWKAKTDLREGLEKTVEWYREHYA